MSAEYNQHEAILQQFRHVGDFRLIPRDAAPERTTSCKITHDDWAVESCETHGVVFPDIKKDSAAAVYCWVVRDGGPKIRYVGKAGKGLHDRCKQHTRGFLESKPGHKNLKHLREALQQGCSVELWMRKPATVDLFGYDTSLHSSEEEALIAILAPAWNKAGRRQPQT